jgi:putative membrane protein
MEKTPEPAEARLANEAEGLPVIVASGWAYEYKLLLVLGIAMALSCIGAPYPQEMYLQHSPTLFLLFFLPWIHRRYPVSRTAFTCLIVFMLFHTLGARYIYSYVPYDRWCESLFGFRLSEEFSFRRNHYDRLAHFLFGLLWTVPVWDVLTRHFRIRPRVAWYFALEFIMAASMLYEAFEWGLTMVLSPKDANSYNGQQGDMWDAQKDMTLAMVGALITAVVMRVRSRREG